MDLRNIFRKIKRTLKANLLNSKAPPKENTATFPAIASKVLNGQGLFVSEYKILQVGITELISNRKFAEVDELFAALPKFQDISERAHIVHSLVIGCLVGERIPTQFQDSIAIVMEAADSAISSTRCDALLGKAQEMLFHSSLHFSGEVSPLSQNPREFLRNWTNSVAIKNIVKEEVRERVNSRTSISKSDVDSGVCFTTFTNKNFLDHIMSHANAVSNGLANFIDIRGKEFTRVPLTIDEQIAFVRGNYEWDRSTLDSITKNKTIFIEWGQRAAVVISHLAQQEQRIVVRIHSYEPFTIFPHLIDAAGVDQLIFVSNIIRNLVFETTPHLASIPTVVLPNAMDLAKFTSEKNHKAAKTLTMLGYGNPEKDPKWALLVLKDLVESDSEWRLLCVGHFFPRNNRPADVRYAKEFNEMISQLGLKGNVNLVDQVDDVRDALQETGWILSTSVRESFHQAVAEGAASAAVPVVRNWPGVEKWGGPADVYPADWIVNTPSQAADRIRRLESTRVEVGMKAREWVLSNLDWSVVSDLYTSAIWGEK